MLLQNQNTGEYTCRWMYALQIQLVCINLKNKMYKKAYAVLRFQRHCRLPMHESTSIKTEVTAEPKSNCAVGSKSNGSYLGGKTGRILST